MLISAVMFLRDKKSVSGQYGYNTVRPNPTPVHSVRGGVGFLAQRHHLRFSTHICRWCGILKVWPRFLLHEAIVDSQTFGWKRFNCEMKTLQWKVTCSFQLHLSLLSGSFPRLKLDEQRNLMKQGRRKKSASSTGKGRKTWGSSVKRRKLNSRADTDSQLNSS